MAKYSHLTDPGEPVEEKQIPEDPSALGRQAEEKYQLSEQEEREMNAHRKKLIGEEKRILEEMKRQREIDLMYELMNTKADRVMAGGKDEITFDFDGKVILIKKPIESSLPVAEYPKVKVKGAVVKGNYIKAALEAARLKNNKKGTTEITQSTKTIEVKPTPTKSTYA